MNQILNTLIFICIGASLMGCSSSEKSVEVTNPDGTKSNVTTDATDGSMKVEGGGVNASMGGNTTISEDQLTIPHYPGSTEKSDECMKVETASEKNYVSVRMSDDSPEKVKEFYESKVEGLKCNIFTAGGKTTMMGSLDRPDGSKIAVSAIRGESDKQTKVTAAYGMEVKK